MGRPRNNAGGLSATEKIENAFWKILELEGFESVTIVRLTQETGLNRNSIYYHYENVENIAKKAIEHNFEKAAEMDFISTLLSMQNDFVLHPEILFRAKKIHLLAGSSSSFLQSFVKKKLIETWLECFNVDSCKLSEVDYVSLEFIASGITSLLGSNVYFDNPKLISSFPTSIVGKAAIQTLQNLPKKK